MKTLYLECNMGAAGDMLMGALSELIDQNQFIQKMNELNIEGIAVEAVPVEKCGIHGTHIKVTVNGKEEESVDVHEHHHHHHDHGDDAHDHHHHHTSMNDVEKIIQSLAISDTVKKNAIAVYKLIAQAESHAHNMPVEEIHFHEVGTKDAIADVVGVCLAMELIGADRVLATPVAVGSGEVQCAHGILPVPAPATAYLLKGIPIYAGNEKGELCTPTGAALLKYFVTDFESMPVMKTEKIGYGMGNKDFKEANCVRAFLGEADDDGEIAELTCNIDDMTPEEIAFANERLMAEGALDVYAISTVTKKGRPGWLFTVMCKTSDKERMLGLVFHYTTTLGIRDTVSRRHALSRSIKTIETKYGKVHFKRSEGYGAVTEKFEYEDLAKIARENNLSIKEVMEEINPIEK